MRSTESDPFVAIVLYKQQPPEFPTPPIFFD